MNFIKDLQKIKELYNKGENIIDYIKTQENQLENSTESIMISYDLQAGSYVKNTRKHPEIKENYTKAIAKVIEKLGHFDSVLEAGVGEATGLANLIPKLTIAPQQVLGFDLSWSRVKYAQSYCQEKKIDHPILFMGDLFNAPVQDSAIDIVYTLHSIEPNGGKEKEALSELYRITNKYLVILEPVYELANEEAQKRMDRLGYVKNLLSTAKELGFEVVEYRSFDYSVNPLNPTGLMIIRKNSEDREIQNPLACPVTKKELKLIKDSYYCEESMLAYPVIDGIPCLLPQNAVIATHYRNF